MRASWEDVAISVVSTVLLAVIAALLFRKRTYRLFPCFFGYLLYHILQAFITESVVISQGVNLTYVWTYYSLQVPSLFLSFLVIDELFQSVMEPYQALSYLGRKIFLVAALVLIIVAVLMVVFGNGPGINRVAYVVFMTLRSLRIVQLGLLISLFLVARSLGLSWRSYSFGIALGYGVYAAVDLVLAAIRAEYGERIWRLHSIMTTGAFTGMLLIWLLYILQHQTVAQPVRVIPHNDIEKWNEKLEELLKRKSA